MILLIRDLNACKQHMFEDIYNPFHNQVCERIRYIYVMSKCTLQNCIDFMLLLLALHHLHVCEILVYVTGESCYDVFTFCSVAKLL